MMKAIYSLIKISVITFLICSFSEINAQNKLQPYLSAMVKSETQDYSAGLNAYSKGEYARAYELLKKDDEKKVPYLESLLQNSLIYQRDNKLIKKALQNDSVKIPEPYKFYIKYPEMKLKMTENSTSVDLAKNLFKATLGDGEEITIMLDTGGSGVGINEELVNKYEMKSDTSISTKGSLPAFNITFSKHPVIIPKITIGKMELNGIYAEYSVPDSESKGQYTGPQFDVIMGLDTFIGYLEEVIFDWENKKLIFRKNSDFNSGRPFLFHSSKPFTSFELNEKNLTTILDTGSAVDLLPKDIYLKNYSKKEKKKYNQYTYNEYTLELNSDSKDVLNLKVADYMDNLNLTIGGEKIDLLIGNGHRKAIFNIKNNRFRLQ